MDVFKEGKYFRYVERAPVWLAISAIVILIGLVSMGVNFARTKAAGGDGHFFNLSIHYTGGDQLILRMKDPLEPDGQNILRIVKKYADGEPIVQVSQPKQLAIGSPAGAAELDANLLLQTGDEPGAGEDVVADPPATGDADEEEVGTEPEVPAEEVTEPVVEADPPIEEVEPVEGDAAATVITDLEEAAAAFGDDVEPSDATPAEELADAGAELTVYSDGKPHDVSIRLRVKTHGTLDAEGVVDGDAVLQHEEVVLALKKNLGDAYGGFEPGINPETIESTFVGPTIGKELIRNTILALIFGCVLIMFYILFRFQRWQMSVAAIGALIHDVLITLGFTALLGLEVSDSFIAVILTIIGYSINDTIIIFDRIRENLRTYSDKVPLAQVCNLSLNQTLIRSVNTVLTVVFMVVALMVFGGENIRDFLTAMLIGMLSGGYSSIFVATPLMLWLSRGTLTVEPETASVAPAGAQASINIPRDEVIEPEVEDFRADNDDQGTAEQRAKKKTGKKQRRR